MFAKFRCWLSQVDRDEDWEGDKKILVEHLIVSDGLIVIVEDGYCSELGHCEEYHHAKTMEVGTEAGSADPQAIDYCF